MSDCLYLKGFGEVVREEGNGMTLTSGRVAKRTTKWWGSGAGKICVPSAVFTVTTDKGDKLNLVIADPSGCRLRIKHDGAGAFNFSDFFGLERAGLFPDNDITPSSLITDYVFPSSPRGVVNSIAVGKLPKASSIGDVLLSGKGTVNLGVSPKATYVVTTTGDSTDNKTELLVSDSGAKINGNEVTFSKAGKFNITVSVTNATATDSPKTATLNVTVKSNQPTTKLGE